MILIIYSLYWVMMSFLYLKMAKILMLEMDEEFEKIIKNENIKTVVKGVFLLCIIFIFSNVVWRAGINAQINYLNGREHFYNGMVNDLVLRTKEGGTLTYDISLEMNETVFVFEDVYVTQAVEKKDQIEIYFNPAGRSMVSKVNGKEVTQYKYNFKGRGEVTGYAKVGRFVVFIAFFTAHLLLYKKERKKGTNKYIQQDSSVYVEVW